MNFVGCTPETLRVGAKAREQAARDIADGKLLTEPNGYYSLPVVLGMLYTGTGRMEILGYTLDRHTAQDVNDALDKHP